MGNERQYFWVRWGDDWEIAINIYDEEEGEFVWILNGMQVITTPDEIGSMIVRESQKLSTSDSALPISDVVGQSEQLLCNSCNGTGFIHDDYMGTGICFCNEEEE